MGRPNKGTGSAGPKNPTTSNGNVNTNSSSKSTNRSTKK